MSNEHADHTVSTPKWTAVFSFAIVGILFFIGLGLPQESQTGAALLKPLLFESPIGNPILTISKTADNSAPSPGDVINYTISYANSVTGSRAFNVQLYDFLPAGAQFISASPMPASSSDGILLFTAPSVGPTTAATDINVQVRILSGYAALNNHVLVTADGVNPATDSLSIMTLPATDHLNLNKDGDVAVLAEGQLEYTLRCQNNGPVTYRNIEVIDVLPTGVTLVSASVPSIENTPPLLKWAIGTLAPDKWWEVTLVTTAPAHIEAITNTASLHAPTHTSMQAMWATEVISEGVILKVDKTGNADEVYPGNSLIYTLTYQNRGSAPASNVVLTDTFPVGVNVSVATPAPASTNAQQRQWVWEIPAMDVGATGTIIITTTVDSDASGMLVNQVNISAPDAWGDSDSLYTGVRRHMIYLPLVLRA